MTLNDIQFHQAWQLIALQMDLFSISRSVIKSLIFLFGLYVLKIFLCLDVLLQLTTKAVEKDSRNRTPHFLCGRLTMIDSSTFTVHSPVPNVPIFLKKPVSENGEKQRCLRSLLNESPNRHAPPVSDAQPLGKLKLKRQKLTFIPMN